MKISLDNFVSDSAQRITIRKRADLTAHQQTYLGKSYWVIKEPIGPTYFRFQAEEYELFQQIDGNTSPDELKEWFEANFPPQRITLEELQKFIGMLYESGLVIDDVPGEEERLRKQYAEEKEKKRRANATVLYFRFKCFDPDRFLNWLHPKIRWLFSVPAFIFLIILALSALTLVAVRFDTFYSNLPDFHSFFSSKNGLCVLVILVLVKLLHEFGHGLMSKHFGCECHEMGVIFQFFVPCFYSNVSDAWMLPSKWKRAAIGAGGMYIEMILIVIATFVWWFTLPAPGMLSMICLNIIVVSSVSMIVFNANPLVSSDGYHILSDLVEVPNLRKKANSVLHRTALQFFRGIKPPVDPFLPQRNQILLAMYSVASGIYRCFALFLVLWGMRQIWK